MEETAKNTPRDVFLYLLSIITLIAGAIGFTVICFQLANIGFPDPLEFRGRESFENDLRTGIAVLLVMFPVYFWVMRFLERDALVNPFKKELKIRKWLLYFTLFVSAIVIIIDLITLIYNFLAGELSARFILKTLSVFVVAFGIFAYYLRVLKPEKYNYARFIPRAALVFFGLAIISGVVVAGLPQSQRLVRLDDRRLSDLYSVENQIIEYWRIRGNLPDDLAEISDFSLGRLGSVPVDPETRQPYEYRKTGNLSFELCAVFSADSKKADINIPKFGSAIQNQFENHKKGRQCAKREINPEDFPKNSETSPRPVPLPVP